jgi:hypothetical protein
MLSLFTPGSAPAGQADTTRVATADNTSLKDDATFMLPSHLGAQIESIHTILLPEHFRIGPGASGQRQRPCASAEPLLTDIRIG